MLEVIVVVVLLRVRNKNKVLSIIKYPSISFPSTTSVLLIMLLTSI